MGAIAPPSHTPPDTLYWVVSRDRHRNVVPVTRWSQPRYYIWEREGGERGEREGGERGERGRREGRERGRREGREREEGGGERERIKRNTSSQYHT